MEDKMCMWCRYKINPITDDSVDVIPSQNEKELGRLNNYYYHAKCHPEAMRYLADYNSVDK